MQTFRVAAASAAVAMLGGVAGAWAADVGAMAAKAPAAPVPVAAAPGGPPTCTNIVDFFVTACQVAAYGVRFYGTVDVGISYQTNGAPLDKFAGSGLTYTPQKMNNGAKWLFARDAMQPSNVGLQIAEPLGGGWKFVGQVEAVWDASSFVLLNGSRALRDVIGEQIGTARGVADSSFQGTFYNSLGFAGFSHDAWGTLTVGRQNAPFRDVLVSYDPAGGSFGFGLIGGNGSLGGGGSTETSKGTTSVKYRVNFANYHLGLFAQFGGYDAGNPSQGNYQANLGGDFKIGPGLLSIDGAGGFAKGAVLQGLTIMNGAFADGTGNPNGLITGVTATISDNTFAEIGVKYTVDRLKLYGGWLWVQFANPSSPVNSFTDIAGNFFLAGSIFNINNMAFPNHKIWNLTWTGARYSFTETVDVYGAFYHLDQNNFILATNTTCFINGDRSSSMCHGTQDSFTAVVDWKFAPKWDTYLGTTYNHLAGGLANGFLHTDFWATTGGVRFRW